MSLEERTTKEVTDIIEDLLRTIRFQRHEIARLNRRLDEFVQEAVSQRDGIAEAENVVVIPIRCRN